MSMHSSKSRTTWIAAALMVALVIGWLGLPAIGQVSKLATSNSGSTSNAQPADKMAVAGSALAIAGPGSQIAILTGQMKTSAPEDAVISVSLECSILTNLTTVGNDNQHAFGQIEVWVELDGTPVPVSHDDTGPDAGHVVFCDRAAAQSTSGFNFDSNATINSFQSTRTADSFNWITLNMGAGNHTFVVKATLTQTATNRATAFAAIGKRTLVVDPTKLAVNAEI
ncbi:MAG: hypothetical protein ACYDDF_04565 [Thermoplasmatota archaeon]